MQWKTRIVARHRRHCALPEASSRTYATPWDARPLLRCAGTHISASVLQGTVTPIPILPYNLRHSEVTWHR